MIHLVYMKILHIEDEVEVARLVKRMLLPECQITHVMNGNEALELASSGNFDIILSDVNLPGLTGFEILKELRALGITTPVISNSSREEANLVMIQQGARASLPKIKSQADVTEDMKSRYLATFSSSI